MDNSQTNEAMDSINSLPDVVEYIKHNNLKHINVGVFDLDGILRGKRMSTAKFFKSLESGFGFCDVILGWDSSDKLMDNLEFTGWHTGYPDAPISIINSSWRKFPFAENGVFILGEFTEKAEELCPRGILKRVLSRLAKQNLYATAGFEYEFFIFNETHKSLEEKQYTHLNPIAPGGFGYSSLRSFVESELFEDYIDTMGTANICLEGLHSETGPGVIEAAIEANNAITSADNAALFKTFTKAFFQRQGLMASFIARWNQELPGSGGHIHISLQNKYGDNAFYDKNNSTNLSKTIQYFLGGMQTYLPEFLCMLAPNVNSYTRLVPGFWAPTTATWGVENRTCAIRVIKGSSTSTRIESRIPGADANPYLALAASIAAGLYGIEQKIEPTTEIKGNAYDQELGSKYQFPLELSSAATRFKNSTIAKEIFGNSFVEHYANTRIWEAMEARKAITDWQIKRYFEII